MSNEDPTLSVRSKVGTQWLCKNRGYSEKEYLITKSTYNNVLFLYLRILLFNSGDIESTSQQNDQNETTGYPYVSLPSTPTLQVIHRWLYRPRNPLTDLSTRVDRTTFPTRRKERCTREVYLRGSERYLVWIRYHRVPKVLVFSSSTVRVVMKTVKNNQFSSVSRSRLSHTLTWWVPILITPVSSEPGSKPLSESVERSHWIDHRLSMTQTSCLH